MALKNKDKTAIIEGLQATHRSAQKLELRLRFKGDDNGANRVLEASTRLSAEIDFLVGRVMEEWEGKANNIIETIRHQRVEIERASREIKDNIDNGKKVVAAVGAIDDIISVASKLSSAV